MKAFILAADILVEFIKKSVEVGGQIDPSLYVRIDFEKWMDEGGSNSMLDHLLWKAD